MSKFKVGDIVSPNEEGAGRITGYNKNVRFTVTKVEKLGKTFWIKEDSVGHSVAYWELAPKERKKYWLSESRIFFTEEGAKAFAAGFTFGRKLFSLVWNTSDYVVLEVEVVAKHTPTTVSTVTWEKKEL